MSIMAEVMMKLPKSPGDKNIVRANAPAKLTRLRNRVREVRVIIELTARLPRSWGEFMR